jgi:hypothetical protein
MKFSITGIDDFISFESTLEAPDGRDPNQNAWLTITIRYSLNFVDGYNDKAGLIVEDGDSKYLALDSDKKPFPIVPWDAGSTTKFRNAFQRGENIWNFRFVLITPRDYDGLDYETLDWKVRPNVLCLFRLVPAVNARPHLSIDVVRLDPSIDRRFFRSNKSLYDDLDVWTPALGHELGHALGLGHIKELLGDTQCIADANRGIFPDRCYGETEWEKAHIMGRGKNIDSLCAKAWLDRIVLHTVDSNGRQNTGWKATLDTNTPPRKIPMAVVLVAPPTQF